MSCRYQYFLWYAVVVNVVVVVLEDDVVFVVFVVGVVDVVVCVVPAVAGELPDLLSVLRK